MNDKSKIVKQWIMNIPKNNLYPIFYFALLIVLVISIPLTKVYSQWDWAPPVFDNGETRYAKELIDKGENDKAISFLLGIYEKQKYKNHRRSVELLVEAMQNAKEYDRLRDFVDGYHNDFPDSLRGYLLEARVYFLTDKDDSGRMVLMRATKELPQTKNKYIQIATEFMRNGIMQDAIDTYLKGRKDLNNPFEFAMELANAYEVTGKYGDAASEYMLLTIGSPRLKNMSNSKIKKLIEDTGETKNIISALEKTAKKYSNNTKISQNEPGKVEILSLLGNAYRAAGEYKKALKTYIDYDKSTEKKGAALSSFLSNCLADKQYNLTIKGAEYIIKTYGDKSRFYWRCRGIIARAYQGNGDYKKAEESFQSIVNETPDKYAKAEALMHLGEIAFTDKKFEEAGRYYNRIINEIPSSSETTKAKMRLGDIQLYSADYDSALSIYSDIKFIGKNDIEPKVMYKSALVEFYKGDFGKAVLNGMKYIFDYPDGEYANDCLLLMDIIHNGKSDSTSLREFAFADYKYYIGDIDAADSIYAAVSEKTTSQSIKEASYLRSMRLDIARGNYNKAIERMENFANLFPNSYYIPNVLLELADTYKDNLNDKTKAEQTYKEILNKFPDSLIIDRVREGLREITEEI